MGESFVKNESKKLSELRKISNAIWELNVLSEEE